MNELEATKHLSYMTSVITLSEIIEICPLTIPGRTFFNTNAHSKFELNPFINTYVTEQKRSADKRMGVHMTDKCSKKMGSGAVSFVIFCVWIRALSP